MNVGPDGEGRIPPGSCEVLQRVGEWLEKNGESIYGTLPMPDTTYQIRWGKLTAGPGRLYLHVLEYPRFPYEILIVGLETAVKRVFLLENGRELTFYQSYEPARDEYRFRVLLPKERSEDLAVTVCAELDGDLKFQKLC